MPKKMSTMHRHMFQCVLTVAVVQLVIVSAMQDGASSGSIHEMTEENEIREKSMKGHLRPFGESGKTLEIEVKDAFPEPKRFFMDYVQRSRPLKLHGVGLDSRAVRMWTDDYLLSLPVPQDSVVNLETMKKEDRLQETTVMHFHDFLRIYNQTEHYMVDDVPPYLRSDLTVPCSLQCPELVDKVLAFVMMWFSSGGTKSVIHTDGFDNINCLIRGEKTFVLVDPARDRQKITFNTVGAYSDIDVDSVDLLKYPAVADMEFYHVNVSAGDCLYIPYKWIHQVRSYHSNVAVNFWWDHHSSLNVMNQTESTCQDQCDPSLTLDKVKLVGSGVITGDYHGVKDMLLDITYNGPVSAHDLHEMFIENLEPSDAKTFAEKIFNMLDLDQDGEFTTEDHAQVPVQVWEEIANQMKDMIKKMEAKQQEWEQEEKELYNSRDEL